MKYSLYLVSKFMCTLTHNSPRCSLLRNGAHRQTVGTPPALSATPGDRCARPASLSRGSRRSSLTMQHREGPRPFSGLFGQRAHGWRQLELPPLNHQLLAAFAAHQLRAVHEAAIQQVVSTGRRHHAHTRAATRSESPRVAPHLHTEPADRFNAPG